MDNLCCMVSALPVHERRHASELLLQKDSCLVQSPMHIAHHTTYHTVQYRPHHPARAERRTGCAGASRSPLAGETAATMPVRELPVSECASSSVSRELRTSLEVFGVSPAGVVRQPWGVVRQPWVR